MQHTTLNSSNDLALRTLLQLEPHTKYACSEYSSGCMAHGKSTSSAFPVRKIHVTHQPRHAWATVRTNIVSISSHVIKNFDRGARE